MPTYDYVCRSCGAEVEVLHGLNSAGPAACDICGGPMRKRVSAPTIVFRGSGWAKKERREAASARTAEKDKDKTKANGKEDAATTTDAASKEAETTSATESKTTGEGSAAASATKEATAG